MIQLLIAAPEMRLVCTSSEFWKEDLEATQLVLDIVTNGYKLLFTAFPQPMVARNHRSALEHSKFVKESIGDLVQSHCIRESLSCPKVCSPLQVVKNAKGKLRLVIDLRYVNQFLNQYKFGLHLIPSLFKKGNFACTFDLISGYHHIDIHKESRPFPGGDGHMKKFYFFLCASLWFIDRLLCVY